MLAVFSLSLSCSFTATLNMNTPTKIYAKSRLASAANKELREKGAFDNYDDAVSAAADGSSYVLLDMSVREFNEADAPESMKTGAASTLYYIQNDGALRSTPQAVPQPVA